MNFTRAGGTSGKGGKVATGSVRRCGSPHHLATSAEGASGPGLCGQGVLSLRYRQEVGVHKDTEKNSPEPYMRKSWGKFCPSLISQLWHWQETAGCSLFTRDRFVLGERTVSKSGYYGDGDECAILKSPPYAHQPAPNNSLLSMVAGKLRVRSQMFALSSHCKNYRW